LKLILKNRNNNITIDPPPEAAGEVVKDAFCPHDVMYVANARNTNHMLKKDLLNSR
jgi:hypothetical protein